MSETATITATTPPGDAANNGSSDPSITTAKPETTCPVGEGGNYWKLRYESLLADYDKLHKINQNLEEKLLQSADTFERAKQELVANNEYEKSTLMADVNKLSTKLVDARIKLHDYEERQLIHASECSAPCHKDTPPLNLPPTTLPTNIRNASTTDSIKREHIQSFNDPNLV